MLAWPLLSGRRTVVAAGCLASLSLAAACSRPAAGDLPPLSPAARQKLALSVAAARLHPRHPWRDISALNTDGTVNAYIEISRGDSTKWEFSIAVNRREVDRMLPAALGGYPVNYGFVPQTVSYDSDPTDVLVLGPPLDGDSVVAGRILALMRMLDGGDLDSKVVAAPLDDRGNPRYALESADRDRITRFFNSYKRHEGKVTHVTGWGDAAEAAAFLRTTAGFYTAGIIGR
jgi:inorganic pyrophosphatase